MKFLCAVSCIVCAVSCFVSCSYGKTNERYRLYPTQNMWTFLKLDTATGNVFSPASWEEIKSSWEMADFVGMLKAPCKVFARGFFVV